MSGKGSDGFEELGGIGWVFGWTERREVVRGW
ncbi:phosphoenolpyruvate carboxylase [Priestia megaterium]|nr:phosphoenolpyruvate carboxylase [Priestia megaterium]